MTPVNLNIDSRRRSLNVSAYVGGLTYLIAFVIANVFSYDHRHGWPLTYMVREHGRKSEFVFWGPWPFDDPPIIGFLMWALVLDVIAGITLTYLIMHCVSYWQRARPLRFQFTLRGLFGITSAVALLITVFMFFVDRSLPAAVFMLLLICYWFVSVVSWCPLLTSAHWIVRRSVESHRHHRLIGFHWLTWLAIAFVSGPLLHYSLWQQTGYVLGGRGPERPGFIMLEAYGWPAEYMAEYEDANRDWYIRDGFSVSYFNPLALTADVLTLLAMVGLTFFVIERWIRRTERQDPINIKSIVAFAAAACALVTVMVLQQSFDPEWYSFTSWAFGVFSAMYALALFVGRVLEYAWKLNRVSRAA